MVGVDLKAQDDTRPDPPTIMGWLDAVPDPEIPAISIVDLGIVRQVAWAGDSLEVTITPTYSGCPATSLIALEIENALRTKGIAKLVLKRQLAPAWTTDWLTEEGRRKLEAYGIAPPQPAGGPARCPLCKSAEVERISQFGSTPCKAQWRCRSCLEPFDYFKCH
jgi:ring-1,2-phenylacetyl-CoA epoxidase subunit PaaD